MCRQPLCDGEKKKKTLLGSCAQVYICACLFSEPLVSVLEKDDYRVKGEQV